MIHYMSDLAWLLLVVSLPTEGATARMRIWRALKALGCMALRDGAYLLPGGGDYPVHRQHLREAVALDQGRPCGLPSRAARRRRRRRHLGC